MTYTPPPSIAAHYADVAEAAAKYGLLLRPKYRQPFGWELYNGDTVATYGSLDDLEQWLKRERKLSAMLTRVVR